MDKLSTALSFCVGAVAHSIDALKMPYRLTGANPGTDAAWISSAFDPVTVRYGGNLQITGKEDRYSLNLLVANEAGRRSSQQTFSVSARLRF